MKNIKILNPSILTIIFTLLACTLFMNKVYFKVKLDNFFFHDNKLQFNMSGFKRIDYNDKIYNLDKSIMNSMNVKLLDKISKNGEFIFFSNKINAEKINLIKLKFFLNFVHESRSSELNYYITNLDEAFILSEKVISINETQLNFFQIIKNYIHAIIFVYLLMFLVTNLSIKNEF